MSVFSFNIYDASPFKQLIEMISGLTTENIYLAVSEHEIHFILNIPNYLNILTNIDTRDILDFHYDEKYANVELGDIKYFVCHFETKKFCDQIKHIKKKSNLVISHEFNSDSLKIRSNSAGENSITIHKSVEKTKFVEMLNVGYCKEAVCIKRSVDSSISGLVINGDDVKLKHSLTGFIFYKNQDTASSMYQEGELSEKIYYVDIKKTKILSKIQNLCENGIITYYSGNENFFRFDLSLSYYGKVRISFLNKKQ